MITPFPGLSDMYRGHLKQVTVDWGIGIDVDRDLWTLRKTHPEARIRGTDHRLHVRTRPVSILWEGKRYEFGTYDIHIPLGNPRSLQIRPVDRSVYRCDYYPHPHVIGSTPCLGDSLGAYTRAAREGRWDDAVTILEQFLSSYGTASPYLVIEHWGSGGLCTTCGDHQRYMLGLCVSCALESPLFRVCQMCGVIQPLDRSKEEGCQRCQPHLFPD